MSEPIVFISHNEGEGRQARRPPGLPATGAKILEAEKPETVAFLADVDDAGSELSIVHVFPDADAMDRHLQGVDERAGAASEYFDAKGYEIYGSPSAPVLETMRGFASSGGVPLMVRRDHVGGYLRPSPG